MFILCEAVFVFHAFPVQLCFFNGFKVTCIKINFKDEGFSFKFDCMF